MFLLYKYFIFFMKNLQTVFNEIEELKKEQKTLKASFRDALSHSASYQELVEAAKKARESKLTAESEIARDFGPEFNRLEEIKNQLNELNVQLSDIAVSNIMKGERIEVYGPNQTEYEPLMQVKFKRKKD